MILKLFLKSWWFCLFIAANNIYAVCDVNIINTSNFDWQGDGYNLGYDVFSEKKLIQQVNFSVQKTEGDNCHIAIAVSAGNSGDPDSRILSNPSNNNYPNLNYNLYLDDKLLKPITPYDPNLDDQDFLFTNFTGSDLQAIDNTGDLDSNSDPGIADLNLSEQQQQLVRNTIVRNLGQASQNTNEVTLYYSIDPQQIVSPGSYNDSLIFTAYEVSGGSYLERDSQNVTLKVTVPTMLDFYFSEDGGFSSKSKSYLVDFGVFGPKVRKEKQLYLVARTNTIFSYDFASQGLGYLLHKDHMLHDYDSGKIKYEFSINNKLVDLSKKNVTFEILDKPKLEGIASVINLSVSPDAVDYKIPGKYEDVVAITAIAE